MNEDDELRQREFTSIEDWSTQPLALTGRFENFAQPPLCIMYIWQPFPPNENHRTPSTLREAV